MIRTRPLTAENVSIMAIVALDDLVNELVRASGLHMAPAFLDWVADVATPLVDAHVAHAFHQPRFARSLHMGDPRIALARWVRHWVCPQIVRSFDDLAVYLPEFSESRPAPAVVLPQAARPAVLPGTVRQTGTGTGTGGWALA
ncbi:MAG: hypothetical protein Q7T46_05365 [Polaromonas sp.]|nr:hypothetical protein [Polaromonas sp.]